MRRRSPTWGPPSVRALNGRNAAVSIRDLVALPSSKDGTFRLLIRIWPHANAAVDRGPRALHASWQTARGALGRVVLDSIFGDRVRRGYRDRVNADRSMAKPPRVISIRAQQFRWFRRPFHWPLSRRIQLRLLAGTITPGTVHAAGRCLGV